jgi:hypothetical protein
LAGVSASVIRRIFTGAKSRNISRDACIPTGGEVDNLRQDVENHVGEEKANMETLRFYNYGR